MLFRMVKLFMFNNFLQIFIHLIQVSSTHSFTLNETFYFGVWRGWRCLMLGSQAWIFSAYRFTWVNNVRFSDVLHSTLLHNFTPYSPPSMPMNITWIYFGEIILTPPIQPVQSGQSLSAHTHQPPTHWFFSCSFQKQFIIQGAWSYLSVCWCVL